MSARRMLGAAIVALVASVAIAGPASAHGGGHGDKSRCSSKGLSSPKGLTLAPNGDPIFSQGAFGPPGPVGQHVVKGKLKGLTIPITEPLGTVDLAQPADRSGWGLLYDANGVVYLEHRDVLTGAPDLQFDIAAYQQGDPDPNNQADDPAESNPYGLAVLPNGDAVFTDAANNDVVRVTVQGVATTIARLGPETIATDHLTPEQLEFLEIPPGVLPPTIDAEAVPTGISVGKDGSIYVGELQGFPFRPGSSDVWKIAPGAEGVECTKGVADPGCKLYKSGFTAIQDIAIQDCRCHKRLFVYELAADGVLAFEMAGENEETPPPARSAQGQGRPRQGARRRPASRARRRVGRRARAGSTSPTGSSLPSVAASSASSTDAGRRSSGPRRGHYVSSHG